jgi:Xaa-Pro aminopeptidase
MNDAFIDKIQKAIREEGLDGWLFCNFRHRDPLSDAILQRSKGLSNSRHWFYAAPASGEALALVHAIEAGHLDGLPGIRKTYVTREELLACLAPLKGPRGGKRWGVHFSENLSAISYLDAGTAALLQRAGLVLVPAEGLVQRFKGLLDAEGIASHEQAAAELYGIVETAWDYVQTAYRAGKGIYEGDIRGLMEGEFIKRGLVRDHPPQAAAGVHSADPHYDFEGPGAELSEGNIIQLDLWAKANGENSIYADIAWAGYFGKKIPREFEKIFSDLVEVREKTYTYLESELSRGLKGADLDARARSLLAASGYGGAIKHRTGHGIDTEVHGSGVNLDSVEFADTRYLLEGSCFSVEPGIYLESFGLRTEINVYIAEGQPHISGAAGGKKRQFKLLSC